MSTIVRCARALVDGEEVRDFAFAVEGERIVATGRDEALLARFRGSDQRVYGDDVAVIPGTVNGHSHAYQILLRGWADDMPFERWRSEALYAVISRLTPEQLYWTFRLAFDEMLGAGITTVVEFFYLNGSGNAHAHEAIRAAEDAGIRLIFARTWMDAPYAPQAFRETIEQARERTQELVNDYPDLPICIAPHSPHAASPKMIAAAADFAREHGYLLHIHLAETAHQSLADLQTLGALHERTVAIHAIHLDEPEKTLLARTGARVVHNPTTNQYLGDGICDVSELKRLGVPIALGTDANIKPSIIDEMRAAAFLQKLRAHDGSALDARTAFTFGTAQGAHALGVEAGALREGAFADYVVLDLHRRDPWAPLVNHVVYRAESADVRETYVAGRCVWRSGESRDALRTSALGVGLASLR